MEINKAVLTLYTSIVIMIKMTEDNINKYENLYMKGRYEII